MVGLISSVSLIRPRETQMSGKTLLVVPVRVSPEAITIGTGELGTTEGPPQGVGIGQSFQGPARTGRLGKVNSLLA